MAAYNSLRELYVTRLREFYRQPARIFWVYGFPTMMAIGLGLAFRNRPPDTIRIDVIRNSLADGVVKALDAPETLGGRPGRPAIRHELVADLPTAKHRLETAQAILAVEPATGGTVRFHYDPTRPEAVTARAAVDDAIQRASGRKDVVPTGEVLVTEPGSRYIDFLIPGLIGLNTMGGGLWGIGFLLVNFRISKLLKRFLATPMPRRNFLLALLGARLTFLLPDVGVLLLMGNLAFSMPFRGSFLDLAIVEIVGALAFAGIGLLIASRAQSTETVSGLMNLVMLPMWLFSGVFFNYANFPKAIQPFIQALPLTQLNDALRQVILRGEGLATVWPSVLILAAWAIGTFLVALRIFRWN